MANYATLKAAINAVIKANGNKEITGTVLNETLTAMVNSLGANYQFAGVATPSTNPGTPDQNVFYIAGQAGTYANFNSTVLPNGLSILKWNGSWSGETVLAGDGVFDISAYHATGGTLATYANLSAALGTNGANIPEALRKGGMSIKFIQGTVQSSDNKYVQARCMAQNFTTDVTQWQGVDDEPTAGSKNLVESGGVSKAIGVNLVGSSIMTDTSLLIRGTGRFIAGNGYVNPDASAVYLLLPCTKGDVVYLKADSSGACKYGYLPNNVVVDYQTVSFCSGTEMMSLSGETILSNIPSDCKYLYILIGRGENVYVDKIFSNFYNTNRRVGNLEETLSTSLPVINDNIAQNTSDISTLNKRIQLSITGSGAYSDANTPYLVDYYFISGSGWTNAANAKCLLIPLNDYNQFIIKSLEGKQGRYVWLKSNNFSEGVPYCDGYSDTIIVPSSEIIIKKPADANYLYVLVTNDGADYALDYVKFGIVTDVANHELEIAELQDDVSDIDKKIGFYYTGTEAALASCPYRKTGMFILGNGTVRSDSNAMYLIIPFENGEKITVNGNGNCRYAYLTSDNLVAGQTAPFCSGYDAIISAAGENEISAVSDCKYLYVLITNTTGSNFLNFVREGVIGYAVNFDKQLNEVDFKVFTNDKKYNKFFKELYFTENADYTLVKKMRVLNCYLDSSKYYVGISFRNAQNQTIYGTNYAFDTLSEAQAYKNEIFTNVLNQYNTVRYFYAVVDYDAIVAEGSATDWIDVTFLNTVNNIHLSPSIEEYLNNENLSVNAYNASAGKYIRFAMFSDPHYLGNGSDEAVYRNNLLLDTINKLQKEKPLQFIISGGDTGFAGINNGVLNDPLPDFRETFLTKFPTQFFSALGNHDGFTVEQWKDAFYHDTQFSFETDGYYFIFLDVYMDGVYDGDERVLTHVLRSYVGTDESSAVRQLLAQYDVDVDANGYCVLQDVLDIPALAAQFSSQVNYEYQGIDFEFMEAELKKAKELKKKPFVVAHTIMGDTQENKERFMALLHTYNAIYLKGHEHYSYHLWENPSSSTYRAYVSCPGWFALDWGGYGGNQTPWAVDVIEIADNGNLRVMHYIPAQTHTRSGQTYNIPESVEEYTIEASGKSLIRATFDLKDFNNNAKAD